MKKIIALLLCAVLAFSMVGCRIVIDGEETAIEVDRLYVNVSAQKLCAFGFYGYRTVDDLLGGAGGIDTQVFNTILTLTGVEDFFGVYTYGFPDAVIHDRTGYDLIRHEITSLKWMV